MNANILGTFCVLKGARYQNNRLAIMARTPATDDDPGGEPVAMLTVNFPHNPLGVGEVAIKDQDGKEGILQALILAGVVKEPHYHIASGFCLYPVCELTEEGLKLEQATPLMESQR